MSGNDVRALYESEVLYSSSYFGGSDPLTNSEGLTPIFLAPIEKYDGSSTPSEVVTSITVRYVDWVVTFALNSDSGPSITVNVPELRVKNIDTGEWSYLIQTAIDVAGLDETISGVIDLE